MRCNRPGKAAHRPGRSLPGPFLSVSFTKLGSRH
jgi:hypothetical protein